MILDVHALIFNDLKLTVPTGWSWAEELLKFEASKPLMMTYESYDMMFSLHCSEAPNQGNFHY